MTSSGVSSMPHAGGPSLPERLLAHLRPLLNYARRRIRAYEAFGDLPPDRVEPEAVVNAALIEVLERPELIPPDGAPFPRLRRAVRSVLEREKRRARQQRRELSLEQPIADQENEDGGEPKRLIDLLPDPAAPPPEDLVVRAEFQRVLERILGQLPDAWREAFLLRVRDGYSLREVAEMEGYGPAEVRRRIERARHFLRARLAEEYEDTAGPPPSEALFAAVEQADVTDAYRDRLRGLLGSVA